MPPISRRTLVNTSIITALAGQWLLASNRPLAIFLLGVCLAASLIEGWWFLIPLGSRWWYPTMLGLLGLTLWREPRGWFFLSWALIEFGTGLRAQAIIRQYQKELMEEQARRDRLAALGFDEPSPDELSPEDDQPVVDAEPVVEPPEPLDWWRPALALPAGLAAAWLGGWISRVFFTFTHWQMDIIAIAIGYMVGRSMFWTVRERSSKALRIAAAIMSGFGVLWGRYLILHNLVFTQIEPPASGLAQAIVILALIIEEPMAAFGPWQLLFVGVGAYAGWRYSDR